MLPVLSGVRVAHLLLLLCMYDFSYFTFLVVYVCFPCPFFVPGLYSFDYCYKLGSFDYSCLLPNKILKRSDFKIICFEGQK